jgi:hypothetical protein
VWKKRGERRENRIFSNLIIIRIATEEPYTQGSTVTSDGLRKHIGSLLWDIFCLFLDIFPT